MAIQYHYSYGRDTWWLSSVTRGDAEVLSGTPVSLEVR